MSGRKEGKGEREAGSKTGRETYNKNSVMKNPDPQPGKQFKKGRQNYLSKSRNTKGPAFQSLKPLLLRILLNPWIRTLCSSRLVERRGQRSVLTGTVSRVVNQLIKFK